MAMIERLTRDSDQGHSFDSNRQDATSENIFGFTSEQIKAMNEQVYGETLYD